MCSRCKWLNTAIPPGAPQGLAALWVRAVALIEGRKRSLGICAVALCLLCNIILSEWHLYVHDYLSATLSLPPQRAGGAFYWISTREGLTSRFNQMEIIHSQLQARNRSLVIIDNPSVHYKDLPAISLCDIFQLPASITCSALSPNVLVQKMQCYMTNVTEQKYQVQGFAVRRGHAARVEGVRPDSIRWDGPDAIDCGLLYGYSFPLVPLPLPPRHGESDASLTLTPARALKIAFTARYPGLLRTMLMRLGEGFSNREFIAVHWRRGDQRQKCTMTKEQSRPGLARDESVNCGTAKEFIDAVEAVVEADRFKRAVESVRASAQAALALASNTSIIAAKAAANSRSDPNPNPTHILHAATLAPSHTPTHTNTAKSNMDPTRRRKVYIATNERDPRILAALSAGGYKIFSDAFAPSGGLLAALGFGRSSYKAPDKSVLSSLDVFVLELLLMAESGSFYGWGPTGVRGFVERMRAEREESERVEARLERLGSLAGMGRG